MFLESQGEQYYIVVRDRFVLQILKRRLSGFEASQLNLQNTELRDYEMQNTQVAEIERKMQRITFKSISEDRYRWKGMKEHRGTKYYQSSNLEKYYPNLYI